MSAAKRDMAASVAARLLNQAKATGDDYQTLLTLYALERLLYRLGLSGVRDRFVLKGALLLRLWSDRPYRATRDLDLLRRGDGDVAVSTVRTYSQAIAAIEDAQPNPIVSTGFAVVRPRELDSRFAAYALRAPYFVERVAANSAGVSYLAHFAVDPELVVMTTHLVGAKTRFLPSNQGRFGRGRESARAAHASGLPDRLPVGVDLRSGQRARPGRSVHPRGGGRGR